LTGERRRLLHLSQEASDTSTSWGQRFRDPDFRQQPGALAQLARETFPEQHSPVEIESLAWALLRSGADAEPLLRGGLSRYHGDFWLNLLLAISLEGKALAMPRDAQSRQIEDAIGYLRAALALRPESAYPHECLGRMLAECGRFDEAVTELKQAIQKQDTMTARYALVRALMLKGDLQGAENASRDAQRLAPQWGPLI